jgi:proteasome-associated ATPase
MTEPTRDTLLADNAKLKSLVEQTRDIIKRQQDEIEALSATPNPVVTFLAWASDPDDEGGRTALVSSGGREQRVGVSPGIDDLARGWKVFLNEASVIIDYEGYALAGTVAEVVAELDFGRVLVKAEQAELVLERAESLAEEPLEAGATVLVDTASKLVLELLRDASQVSRMWLEEVPDVTYADIGGLDAAVGEIRDAVELPYLHPRLFDQLNLAPPKGILLYGPPGTGKTMIAKAVANQLASGKPGARPHFLSVKGPELLDKWVGESERKIREIFDRARNLAAEGDPVVIFFDEMESVFRVRGSGVSADTESTMVPQLLTELDGVEGLHNVIVIGASNRQDLIDPAVLRPGRLDVKIMIGRPDREAAHSIFLKYLTDDLPYAEKGRTAFTLAPEAVDALYAEGPETEFLEVIYANGEKEKLHFGDFASGAMIKGIVDRAKLAAIKAHLDGEPLAISVTHLKDAVAKEFSETEDLPNTTSPEDWAKLSGFKGDIARIKRIFRDAGEQKKKTETVEKTGQYL